MINLIDLYKELKQPINKATESQARFTACAIPGYSSHRLAKDVNNFPCLLIATHDPQSSNRPAPIKLEHLEVLYDVNCKISHKDSWEKHRFTVICCRTHDTSMQDYFLRTANAIIELIGDSPSHKEVAKAVDSLVELFRVLSAAPRKSLQGLWAEVFIISIASNPISLIKSWHRSPDDIYDFSAENKRVEIKSATSSKLRQHHFSLAQLNPIHGESVVIASVFVERIGAGTSLNDLVESLSVRINKEPELLLYLDQMIGATLGNNWRSATKDKFDLDLAKKSLAFFNAEKVPSADTRVPKEVSEIHFKVDLTNVTRIDKKVLKLDSGLFKAVAPR